jgi:hypothetical protein
VDADDQPMPTRTLPNVSADPARLRIPFSVVPARTFAERLRAERLRAGLTLHTGPHLGQSGLSALGLTQQRDPSTGEAGCRPTRASKSLHDIRRREEAGPPYGRDSFCRYLGVGWTGLGSSG